MKFIIIIIIVTVFSLRDFSICYKFDSLDLSNKLLSEKLLPKISVECHEKIQDELKVCNDESTDRWSGEGFPKSFCCSTWDIIACSRQVKANHLQGQIVLKCFPVLKNASK